MSLLDIGITDATDKELLEHIDNPRTRKIIEVIQEVENGIITIGLPDWTNGFNTVSKDDFITFLYDKEFRYKLLYSTDMVMLQIDFEQVYSTEDINRSWGYFSLNKHFESMEIYFNYRDFIKLKGIGYDEEIDTVIKDFNLY